MSQWHPAQDRLLERMIMPTSVNHMASQVEALRKTFNGVSSRETRSKAGQFLTPAALAQFMASLFDRCVGHVRILDPGAGAGALFAACVAEFCRRERNPQSIEVVACEIENKLLSSLKQTMTLCREICREAGVQFDGTVLKADFVPVGLEETEYSLFNVERRSFTHVIMNPPYKKINGQSSTRKMLDAAGMGTSNLYSAFVWLALRMLEPRGELVAITPRSFCNGPYFRNFRRALLDQAALRRFHVFQSRKKAFADDSVLQENIIFHAIQGEPQRSHVRISVSEGPSFGQSVSQDVPFEHVVLPEDADAFIHLIQDENGNEVMERMGRFCTRLETLGVEVSTGRVVDFRARAFLRNESEEGTVPLIYPCHFQDGFVRWPAVNGKKPNAIVSSEDTRDLLITGGCYVLTKRFSAKEERRRIVAAIYDFQQICVPFVGFENHLNYFHAKGKGLSRNLAKGLSVYLNSSLCDRYFRLFSGHTQVNATDLRKMRYPSREQLLRLGAHVKEKMPEQERLDEILAKVCESNG